jgi:ribosomal protein S18 acetylase RimI-like enzyme
MIQRTIEKETMLHIFNADLGNADQAAAFVHLLDGYARDPMGGASPLPDSVRATLAEEVRKRSSIKVVLAYWNDEPAGFSTCMEGFSTFAGKPLLNIHDIAVDPRFRGHGIARSLLAYIEDMACKMDCCKITLEVLEGNLPARSLYASQGFAGYELDPAMGGAILMQKKL